MALFRFRTRNPERDRDRRGRLQRLHQSLATSALKWSARNGLRDRYDKVTADAAFSQQTLEDGRGGAACRRRSTT